ncbi:MAG TPA: NADH-quinone oxidoreductase subunit M [Solirubrobacteraceae bacterium]|nr:NADH-quinone oxidoreductase subunit M [Solirubrobacteraceae bacterium]
MTIHLSIVLWLPLAAGVLAVILPRAAARWVSLLGALAVLAYAIVLVADYDTARGGLQHVTDVVWIRSLGIHYKLAVSGLNLFLILTTAIVFTAAALWSALREGRIPRPGLYALLMGLAETGVLGAFMAQDLALFVVFFDLMLVPFYFLTLVWGGPDRTRAVLKLFIYTLVGSLLMLVGAIATGVLAAKGGTPTFVLSDLQRHPLTRSSQEWIFLVFTLAFLIKMPAFPFHGWMPDGYQQMPIPVLAVFTAILSKVAAYGFLQVAIPLFPKAAVHFQELVMLVALASILYGSAMAFTTTRARLVLGYSSVAQLGFIVLGIFALNSRGADGALLQSMNHALVAGPMILIVALLAARTGGSEDIRDMGGMAVRGPLLAAVFLVLTYALLAMPGSANFIGEFFILLGVFQSKLALAVVAFAGVVMAAVYALRLYIRSMHNRVGADVEPRELGWRAGVVLIPMMLVVLALALYPQIALKRGDRAATRAIAGARLVQAAGSLATAPAQEARR